MAAHATENRMHVRCHVEHIRQSGAPGTRFAAFFERTQHELGHFTRQTVHVGGAPSSLGKEKGLGHDCAKNYHKTFARTNRFRAYLRAPLEGTFAGRS